MSSQPSGGDDAPAGGKDASTGAHDVPPAALWDPKHELIPKIGDRDLFPRLKPLVYCNHASIAPPTIAVKHAVVSVVEDYMANGAGALPGWLAQRERLKTRLGAFLGCAAQDVALTGSTGRGLSEVALGINWQPGDRVIAFRGEFPANVVPWQRARDRFGVELVMLDADAFRTGREVALETLRAEVQKGARLVAVSAVQFQTGFRMPLEDIVRIAKEVGAEVCVDGIQALGVLPMNVRELGVDYLAGGAHKWLMALEGVGFLFARPEAAARLRPAAANWLSVEDPVDFLLEGPDRLRYDKPLRKTIDVLESTSTNAAGCAALEAALELTLQLDLKKVFAHVQAFLDEVEEAAIEHGYVSVRSTEIEERSGILSLRPPADADVVQIARHFADLGVPVSTPDGYLRISPSWPNNQGEADQVAYTLGEALKRARNAT